MPQLETVEDKIEAFRRMIVESGKFSAPEAEAIANFGRVVADAVRAEGRGGPDVHCPTCACRLAGGPR